MSESRTPNLLTVCASVIALTCGGWALSVSQGIVVPIVLGGLMAFLLDTLAKASAKVPLIGKRASYSARVGFAFFVTFVVLIVIVAMIARNIEQVVKVLPAYSETFLMLVGNFMDRFGYEVDLSWHNLQQTMSNTFSFRSVILYSVSAFSGSIAYMVLVFIYALFFLVEARHINTKISRIFRTPDNEKLARQVIQDISGKVGAYMAYKTLINVVLAAITFVVLKLYGIEFAIFWAILTGIFNYIPYVGSIVAVTMPIFVSVGQYEFLETTFTLALALTAVQMFIGYFLEPRWLGKQLNISPLVILIGLSIWGSLWGIAGAILSVPLTAMIMIVSAAFYSGRSLAIILSETGDIGNGNPDN